MAFKRKRKYGNRSNQIPDKIEDKIDFTFKERKEYFSEAVELLDVPKCCSNGDSISWELFHPSHFINGSTHHEVQLRFPTNPSIDTNSWIPIGELNMTGNLGGIFNVANSDYVRKTCICWFIETEDHRLCIWVTLPSAAQVVLGLPITVSNKSAIIELSRRGNSSSAAMVWLMCKSCLQTEDQIDIFVLASTRALNEGGADHIPLTKIHKIPENVVQLFCNVNETNIDVESVVLESLDCEDSVKARIFQFYKWVRSHQDRILQSKQIAPLPSTVPGLTATLHGYQVSAVQWMLWREEAQGWTDIVNTSGIHPLWCGPVCDTGDRTLYYNRYTGKLSFERYAHPLPVKGGILADEMGLGKTVEVLALIMIHKWPPGESHSSLITQYLASVRAEPGTSMEAMEVYIKQEPEDIDDGVGDQSERMDTIKQEPEDINGEDDHLQRERRDTMNGFWQHEEKFTISSQQSEDGSTPSVDHSDDVWCLCGSSNGGDGKIWVQCCLCRTWQHAECADQDNSSDEDYVCVRCLLKKPISCGTTLIIVPESLLHQWLEELAKHTDIESLNVVIYLGVAHEYVNPLRIVSQDIVMVTYESLRRELDRVHHQEFTRMLRKKKKWAYPPSPLLAINWWRICLDEAQMVESTNTKAAEMTHRLTSVNRWCVTGTPVQRNLADLFGLVYFLGYSPYCTHQWWTSLIWLPYCQYNPKPMVKLFADLMWRQSKEDVADELCLPEMKEETHWLTFSAVESFFYKKQEKFCMEKFLKAITDLELDDFDYTVSELQSVNRSAVPKLLNPLLTLRQACGHPQLVREGYLSIGQYSRSHMTMSDLLKKLVLQAKVEGRENLRQVVAGFNGQAAIYIIQEKFKTAIDTYREAMSVWKSHEENFVCDRMQRIHTMENLASVLEMGHAPDTRALSDDNLRKEASALRSEYLRKHEYQLLTGINSLSTATSNTQKELDKAYQIYYVKEEERVYVVDHTSSPDPPLEEEDLEDTQTMDNTSSITALPTDCKRFDEGLSMEIKDPPCEFWWSKVIGWATEVERDQELLSVLEADIQTSVDYQNSFFSFRELSGLDLAVVNYITKLQKARVSVLMSLSPLSQPGLLPEDILSRSVSCHIRSSNDQQRSTSIEPCDFCQVESEINEYKLILFGTDTSSNLSYTMSICEKALKCVLGFSKAKGAPQILCQAGDQFMRYFEALKKEFKHIKKLWLTAEQKARGCDELNMCSSRFTDVVPDRESMASLYLSKSEITPMLMQFSADVRSAKSKLKKSFGQLMYLQNLVKANNSTEKEAGPSLTCPVCTTELEVEWSVLSCGHSLCMECLNMLMKKYISPRHSHLPRSLRIANFPCPMCRDTISSRTVQYIKTNKKTDEVDIEEDDLMEQYSTKVRSVVSTLKQIQLKEPGAKSLVFSSFSEVLKLISHALHETKVQYSFLQTKYDFKTKLPLFKTSPTLNVLLLPMSSGSKGLNITEATHVLLVEPCLNIGAELQAIGRIHRVGQTKPTKVHRFYIRDTIEESIRTILASSTNLSNFIMTSTITEQDCNLTIKDLQGLILRSDTQ